MLGEIGHPDLGPHRDYHYCGPCSRSWAGVSGRELAVILALLLGVMLLVATSGCTIKRVILYNTEQCPQPKVTPLAKIGPS